MNIKDLSKNIRRRSELFADVVSACSTLLKYSSSADQTREYLNNRISKQTQVKFGFGYFPHNNNLHEIFEYVSKDVLLELGLIYLPKASDIDVNTGTYSGILNNHNLIMPYNNLYGDIISVVGRTLISGEEQNKLNISKYKNTSFRKNLHLYNLNNAKDFILEKNSVILVEGQFDAIACYSAGFKNVVALGCTNLSKHQFAILKRYTDNFFLMLDSDDSGKSGADKIVKKYCKYADIQIVSLPEGFKDVFEYLKNNSNPIIFDFLKNN